MARGKSGVGSGVCGKKAPRWLLVLAAVLVSLMVAALLISYVVLPAASIPPAVFARPQAQAQAQTESFFAQGSKILFLYMNGCGWCEKFRPQWDEFTKKYAAELSSLGVEAAAYERSEAESREFTPQVSGYPTVLFVSPSGSVTKFEGERTEDALIAFVRGAAAKKVSESFYDAGSEPKSLTSSLMTIASAGASTAHRVGSALDQSGKKNAGGKFV
jgi:hypothetical protein